MSTLLQERLFEQIFRQFKSNTTAIAEISRLLDVSRTSIYNRANGSVALSAEELEKLMTHFDISPLAIYEQQAGRVVFDYNPLRVISKDAQNAQDDYLRNVIRDLQRVANSATGQMSYLSTDLPFFYYFIHKELAWFKRYLYQHNQSNERTSKLPKINFEDIQEEHQTAFKKMLQLYCQVPSEEIWTSQALQATVSEIKYFVEMGLFYNPDDALLLMDKLLDTAERLFLMVSENNKGMLLDQPMKGQSIELYYNDFNRFNTTIMTRTDRFSGLYVTYDLPNYLYTVDQGFSDYTIEWIARIKKKSYRLSGSSDLPQLRYFNRLKQFLRREKHSIENLLGNT